MSEDTYTGELNDPLSLNLYTYCFNNPLTYLDPTGHIVTASDKANLTDAGQALIQLYTDNYNTYNDAMKHYAKDSVDYYEYKKLRDSQGQKANDVRTSDTFDVHKQTNDISSNNTTSNSTSVSAAPATYTANQQAQYYLNKMGFDVGSFNKGTPDGVMGVRSSSALLMVQWISGMQITGEVDKDTLKILKYLIEHGLTYEMIDDFAGEKWTPEKPKIDKVKEATNNGHYDPETDMRFARVPGSGGSNSYLEDNAAVSWSMLINAALKYNKDASASDDLDINKLAVGEGLRDYNTQVDLWKKYLRKEGNKAVEPKDGYGTSNHGWGVAMDLKTGDPGSGGLFDSKTKKHIKGTGYSTTKEVKWLESNAGSYGFQAYYYDKENKKFRETWHWDYVGKSKSNK